jgi:hypothetical protein
VLRLFRGRTGGWWALFLCAALAMGCYITFDMLDLDESDLPFQLSNLGHASKAQGLETEDILQQLPALVEHPYVMLPAFLSCSTEWLAVPAQATSRVAPPEVLPRIVRFRRQARLVRGRASASASASPTDIPA